MSLNVQYVPERVLFSRLLEGLIPVIAVFKNAGKRSTAKNYHSVRLLSLVSKVFKKLVIRLLIAERNVAFSLISSMVLGLLDHLQIF